MLTASICLQDIDGKIKPVSYFFSPYIVYHDRHEIGRYFLKDKEKDIILEIIEQETEATPIVIIKEYKWVDNREKYTKLFHNVICDDIADRSRYEIIAPKAISEPLASEIAKRLRDYKSTTK